MYDIKILTDEEFDKLPYNEAPVSLGLADTKSNKAYVRYVANDELQKYLINHEFEHLIGEDRDEVHHGGNGVYYKGFGNIFSALQGAGQTIGRAASGAGQSIAGAGKSVMGLFNQPQAKTAVAGAQPSGFPNPMGTPMGGVPKPISSIQQGISPQLSTQQLMSSKSAMAAANPTGQVLRGGKLSQSPLTSPFGLSQDPTQGNPVFKGNPNISPSFNINLPSNPKQAMSMFNPGSQPTHQGFNQTSNPQPPPMMPSGGSSSPNVIPTARPGASPMSGFFGEGQNPKQFGLGAGVQALGQFGIKNPKVPDIGELPSVANLRNFSFRNFQELDPALEQAINRDFDRIDMREREELIKAYKGLRPGADYESDSNFRRDIQDMERRQAERRMDSMAKYRFDFITKQLQMSQLELEQATQIAQMDVDQIMMQFGMDYAEAQKFKDTFSRAGDMLMTKGLGINQGTPKTEEKSSNAQP